MSALKITLSIAMFMLASCASHSNDIAPAYVSPLQYKDYSCDQLAEEMERVSRRTSELAGNIDKKADGDSMQMGVGLILFWPTLFFLDGDGPEAQEYARLKGEFDTLERVAVQKQCNIKIERPQPPKPESKSPTSAYPQPSH